MAKLFGDCELALSKPELDEAIRLYVKQRFLFTEFKLRSVNISSGSKYVVRAVLEPPEAGKVVKHRLSEVAQHLNSVALEVEQDQK